MDQGRVKATIARSLVSGTDPAAVLGYLDSQGIQHTPYVLADRRIYAEIPRSTLGIFNGHIHIEFRFSADEKLTGYEVKELFDSF